MLVGLLVDAVAAAVDEAGAGAEVELVVNVDDETEDEPVLELVGPGFECMFHRAKSEYYWTRKSLFSQTSIR